MTRALGTFAAMLVVVIACASVIGLVGVLMRASQEVGRRAGYTAAVDSVRAAGTDTSEAFPLVVGVDTTRKVARVFLVLRHATYDTLWYRSPLTEGGR